MKLQKFIINLVSIYKRYRQYVASMNSFVKRYPPMTEQELEKLEGEKCCICWEALQINKCSRISCGHIHHIDCIRIWILNNPEKRCPLCKQQFLQPEPSQEQSFWSYFSFFRNAAINRAQREMEIEQVRQILPHIPQEVIRRELDRTGSMDETIANMLEQE